MKETDEMINKLAKSHYNVDKVKPINPRQTLTDEELIKLFTSMEGNYFEVSELKNILEGKVKVNAEDIKTSVISSTYLFRMCKLTGKRWRQKRALGESGEMLIKFYTDGKWSMNTRRRRKK